MDKHEEKEAPLITMRHIRALAGKRGYCVIRDDAHLHVVNKSNEQIICSFDLHDPFRIDPLCTQQFTLIRIYFWLRGYHLTYEEPTTVKIACAEHHPIWNLRHPGAKQFTYGGLFLLLSDIAIWTHSLETHHCPLKEMLLMEERVPMSQSEHDIA